MTATTDEAPEHRACRDRTPKERRGVEAALGLWRLGDSNWRNIYIGTRHVGVMWEPGLPRQVITAMNDRTGNVPVDNPEPPWTQATEATQRDAAARTPQPEGSGMDTAISRWPRAAVEAVVAGLSEAPWPCDHGGKTSTDSADWHTCEPCTATAVLDALYAAGLTSDFTPPAVCHPVFETDQRDEAR